MKLDFLFSQFNSSEIDKNEICMYIVRVYYMHSLDCRVLCVCYLEISVSSSFCGRRIFVMADDNLLFLHWNFVVYRTLFFCLTHTAAAIAVAVYLSTIQLDRLTARTRCTVVGVHTSALFAYACVCVCSRIRSAFLLFVASIWSGMLRWIRRNSHNLLDCIDILYAICLCRTNAVSASMIWCEVWWDFSFVSSSCGLPDGSNMQQIDEHEFWQLKSNR